MRQRVLFFGNLIMGLMLFAGGTGIAQQRSVHAVPRLDELASDWLPTAGLRNFPSAMNFAGGLQVTRNITGWQNLCFAPYAQGRIKPYSWSEGLNSPGLSQDQAEEGDCAWWVDELPVVAESTRWLPYEVQRKGLVDGVEMQSSIRLPFERKGVMERVVLHNGGHSTRRLVVVMHCFGRIRQYSPAAWRTWANARPADSNFDITANGRHGLVVRDRASAAVTRFSFVTLPAVINAGVSNGEVTWVIRLAAGKSQTIEWSCIVGEDMPVDFGRHWEEARRQWEDRWQAAFQPGNKFFSGHLPTLVTKDANVRRVYYMGALTPLLMCRTDLPLSPRCYVTAGPQWANTLTYFWDAEMWANSWAMLDPAMMRAQLLKWLSMDIHRCYAVDCLSGGGAGPWYAANDWSVFRCAEAYLGVTGDTAFLHQMVDGRSVLRHLEEIATYYETRPLRPGSPLANYGGPENLLECSPSYIQGVPSLNAANVYMLRSVASFYARSGNAAHAEELQAKAGKLLPAVISLYAKGQGVWNAIDTTGATVPIRHCYDYIVTGQALENDLSSQVKVEMNHFVTTELLTKGWMRAMSLRDPAAAKSDRPDHGPMGSYDAWPPMTMDVLCRFGDFSAALHFLHGVEPITHQGPWAQSHEFIGRGAGIVVRTASRGGQDANEGCGAAYAEVIIRGFFGFRPDKSVNSPVLLLPDSPRGFEGRLEHVSWKKKLFTMVSDEHGVHIEADK